MFRKLLISLLALVAISCTIYEPIDLAKSPNLGFDKSENPNRNFYRDTIYIHPNSITSTGGKYVLVKRADYLCAIMFDNFKRVKNRQPDKSGVKGDPIEVSDYTAINFQMQANNQYAQTDTVKGIISVGPWYGNGFHTSTSPYSRSHVNCGKKIPIRATFGGNFSIDSNRESKSNPFIDFYISPTNFSEINAERINKNLAKFKWYQTLDGYGKTIQIKLSDLQYE